MRLGKFLENIGRNTVVQFELGLHYLAGLRFKAGCVAGRAL